MCIHSMNSRLHAKAIMYLCYPTIISFFGMHIVWVQPGEYVIDSNENLYLVISKSYVTSYVGLQYIHDVHAIHVGRYRMLVYVQKK